MATKKPRTKPPARCDADQENRERVLDETQPPNAETRVSTTDMVLALLRRDSGATLEGLLRATGWQAHTASADNAPQEPRPLALYEIREHPASRAPTNKRAHRMPALPR
jgi:hypothetical protein